MNKQKITKSIIATFIILCPASSFAQKAEKIFTDTMPGIVTDSFSHDLGNIPMINNKLTKLFKYTGADTVFITRTWTGDPHYICEYPKEPILKGKIYSLTVCFWNEGRPGLFKTVMGFTLSNGKEIAFIFKGNVIKKE